MKVDLTAQDSKSQVSQFRVMDAELKEVFDGVGNHIFGFHQVTTPFDPTTNFSSVTFKLFELKDIGDLLDRDKQASEYIMNCQQHKWARASGAKIGVYGTWKSRNLARQPR